MPDEINGRIEDREILRAFAALGHWSNNARHMMEEIGQAYERRVLENFERQGDPEGHPWQRLAEFTLGRNLGKGKRLRKSGSLSAAGKAYLQGKRILVESGRLRRGIHYKAGAGFVRIGVGGNLPYAAIHQFGGTIRPKNKKALSFGAGPKGAVKIPARPYLAMNEGQGFRLAARDQQMVLQIAYRRLGDVVEGRK